MAKLQLVNNKDFNNKSKTISTTVDDNNSEHYPQILLSSSTSDSWIDKYKPTDLSELPIFHTKIKDLNDWLERSVSYYDHLDSSNTIDSTLCRTPVLGLCGRSGCCKSSLLLLLCEKLQIEIQEWSDDLWDTTEYNNRNNSTTTIYNNNNSSQYIERSNNITDNDTTNTNYSSYINHTGHGYSNAANDLFSIAGISKHKWISKSQQMEELALKSKYPALQIEGRNQSGNNILSSTLSHPSINHIDRIHPKQKQRGEGREASSSVLSQQRLCRQKSISSISTNISYNSSLATTTRKVISKIQDRNDHSNVDTDNDSSIDEDEDTDDCDEIDATLSQPTKQQQQQQYATTTATNNPRRKRKIIVLHDLVSFQSSFQNNINTSYDFLLNCSCPVVLILSNITGKEDLHYAVDKVLPRHIMNRIDFEAMYFLPITELKIMKVLYSILMKEKKKPQHQLGHRQRYSDRTSSHSHSHISVVTVKKTTGTTQQKNLKGEKEIKERYNSIVQEIAINSLGDVRHAITQLQLYTEHHTIHRCTTKDNIAAAIVTTTTDKRQISSELILPDNGEEVEEELFDNDNNDDIIAKDLNMKRRKRKNDLTSQKQPINNENQSNLNQRNSIIVPYHVHNQNSSALNSIVPMGGGRVSLTGKRDVAYSSLYSVGKLLHAKLDRAGKMKFEVEEMKSPLPNEVLLLFLQWNTIASLQTTPRIIPCPTSLSSTISSTTLSNHKEIDCTVVDTYNYEEAELQQLIQIDRSYSMYSEVDMLIAMKYNPAIAMDRSNPGVSSSDGATSRYDNNSSNQLTVIDPYIHSILNRIPAVSRGIGQAEVVAQAKAMGMKETMVPIYASKYTKYRSESSIIKYKLKNTLESICQQTVNNNHYNNTIRTLAVTCSDLVQNILPYYRIIRHYVLQTTSILNSHNLAVNNQQSQKGDIIFHGQQQTHRDNHHNQPLGYGYYHQNIIRKLPIYNEFIDNLLDNVYDIHKDILYNYKYHNNEEVNLHQHHQSTNYSIVMDNDSMLAMDDIEEF